MSSGKTVVSWLDTLTVEFVPHGRKFYAGIEIKSDACAYDARPSDEAKAASNWSEFEAGVVDGEADVAIGLGEAADGFHLVYVGFEHDDCDGNGLAG